MPGCSTFREYENSAIGVKTGSYVKRHAVPRRRHECVESAAVQQTAFSVHSLAPQKQGAAQQQGKMQAMQVLCVRGQRMPTACLQCPSGARGPAGSNARQQLS